MSEGESLGIREEDEMLSESQSCKSRLRPHRGWAGQDAGLLPVNLKWGKLVAGGAAPFPDPQSLGWGRAEPVSQALQAGCGARVTLKCLKAKSSRKEELCTPRGN